jgi:hypothetical protein
MSEDLAARVDRLESIEQIRRLAAAYAVAVDARDLDALVALYVEDIRVGPEKQGRAALKEIFSRSLRQFTTSAHLLGGHVIEFVDADNALGLVYSRMEHEVGVKWVSSINLYHDRYQRRGARWYFRGRIPGRIYATAEDDPPVGQNKIRWPGAEPAEANFHDALPSWAEFWGGVEGQAAADDVADHFVTRLRRTTSLPPPPRFIF